MSRNLAQEKRIQQAIELAASLQTAANQFETKKERELALLIENPQVKALMTAVADQVFRCSSVKRGGDQLRYLIQKWGISKELPFPIRIGLKLLEQGAWFLFPFVQHYIYYKTNHVVLLEEGLNAHLKKRQKENIRLNINHLGEAILGEGEAKRRLEVFLQSLKNPHIETISVKVSTLYSQIQMLDWDNTLKILSERYKKLLLVAQDQHKFVNLDMEEYKDFLLTLALFKQVLSEYKDISAGIVLQSYLPDSYHQLIDLTKFALEKGGAPIKIRLVKGANLAMEKVEASIKNWPLAPYDKKSDVDANFIQMIDYAFQKEHIQAVHIGIGSHNLFDIAYAFILATERDVLKYVTFEMLEGMGEPIQKSIHSLVPDLLLYCPVTERHNFQNAIAYLVRRLDENTAPDNFLKVAFHLKPGTAVWERQAAFFSDSVMQPVKTTPNRIQDRQNETYVPTLSFKNEPDTDWSLTCNQIWGQNIIKEWKEKQISPIPLVIGGKEKLIDPKGKGIDPSRPDFPSYTYQMGCQEDIDLCLREENMELNRKQLLQNIAKELYKRRASLMGAMLRDVGKSLYESDAEVSEAIDFAHYYQTLIPLECKPKGRVLIASPWNFPCSIPAGGIIAALGAGNSVIFKPAPEAVLVGYELVKAFYEAGVPKNLLQFFPCKDDVASLLVQDERIATVVLTGATETALQLFKLRPGLDLVAETGGKNSLIVTALADRDLAVRDIVHSAFSYSGQKCSACSLAILEAEVFDDPRFQKQLKDAIESLHVGSAYDPASKITPLIRPPEGPLEKALLEKNWMIFPKIDPQNPHLLSPGVLWDVKPGSFIHQNELFGPILAVMRARDLDHAIEMANDTSYGLTAGLHSLDVREHEVWLSKIRAGNCYINRGITGAIVGRQPFGGTKKSSFGPGLKAGGPNALVPLMQPRAFEFSLRESDPMHILGQKNIQRYIPLDLVILRLLPADSVSDAKEVLRAAQSCQTSLKISVHPDFKEPVEWDKESDEEFLRHAKGARIRLLSWPEPFVVKKLSENGLWQMPKPVLREGELLNYVREVSISYDYHRYGNLGND